MPEQDYAVAWIKGAYAHGGLKPTDLELIQWYTTTECIPSPFDDEHDTGCRRGRAIPDVLFGWWCHVEVVWRGDPEPSFSQTSLAHELMHCALWDDYGDSDHSNANWYSLLPQLNEQLAAQGL